MPINRLSALDAAFVAVETPSAHMHVGWAAVCSPPREGQRPAFEELREHVAERLPRAPRYRQRMAPVPFSMHNPEWIDDPKFDVDRHVLHSRASKLTEVIDECMSRPLRRDRPLWQLWIADRLEDGSIGVVGKAHHCMVDGIAAVELASLLLDPDPDPLPPEPDQWIPAEPPSPPQLFLRAFGDRLRDQLELATHTARLVASPRRLLGAPGTALRIGRAVAGSLRPAPASTPLNEPISPRRHLALLERPLEDLRTIKRGFGATVNDVVLAASAGGVRRFLEERGEGPSRLKAMVPVNVRAEDGDGDLGNRISFMFIDLPCEKADAASRFAAIRAEVGARKEEGEPEAADSVLRSLAYLPRTIQLAASRLVASPRVFNLVVSNIPGPTETLYMRGCELRCAFPVVPLADQHGLSIGFTTIRERACFGLYADRRSLPDSDALAVEIDRELDQLMELAEKGRTEAKADMVTA
jgi:WS/DGAT/MGAT family acyltransferase